MNPISAVAATESVDGKTVSGTLYTFANGSQWFGANETRGRSFFRRVASRSAGTALQTAITALMSTSSKRK